MVAEDVEHCYRERNHQGLANELLDGVATRAELGPRLSEGGMRVVQTPFRAPCVNAYAERFVRSIKEECLSRVITFGEPFGSDDRRARRALPP